MHLMFTLLLHQGSLTRNISFRNPDLSLFLSLMLHLFILFVFKIRVYTIQQYNLHIHHTEIRKTVTITTITITTKWILIYKNHNTSQLINNMINIEYIYLPILPHIEQYFHKFFFLFSV